MDKCNFSKNLKINLGFTLVELMVVVAIIGILASIAIPQFQTYQAKSKSTEAKLALSGIYTAQASFFSSYDTYHSCLSTMGHSPPIRRYYAQGMTNVPAISVPEMPSCSSVYQVDNNVWQQTILVGGAFVLPTELPNLVGTTPSTYEAYACGNIATSHNGNSCLAGANNPDSWSVNQDKTLTHLNTGY